MATTVLSHSLASLSGRLGNFVHRQTARGQVMALRPEQRWRRPATEEQWVVQRLLRESNRAWMRMTDEDRNVWEWFAKRFRRGRSGQQAFLSAAWHRGAMGRDAAVGVPGELRVVGAVEVEAVETTDEGSVAMRVWHGVTNEVGEWRLFVQASAGMGAVSVRKPKRKEVRAVRGIGPQSYAVLQPSDSVYVFENARYIVPAGETYGVRVVLIDPDGLPAGEARWNGRKVIR